MVSFPNAKINLGLNILRKREDGFHDLASVFYPVMLKDALEIIPHTEEAHPQITITGIPVSGEPAENLCIKAFNALKKDFPGIPNVAIHLHKVIPMGAGLGGGSADAAFTLLMLNRLYSLNLSEDQLKNYALHLGSDCPFFLLNKPCLAMGRGEQLQPIKLDLSPYQILLINPGIHVSTREAFAGMVPGSPAQPISDIITKPVKEWKDSLFNDFENTVGKQYPQIGEIKETLYQRGALYASMTGSGSTVYGLFEKDKSIDLSFGPTCQVFPLG